MQDLNWLMGRLRNRNLSINKRGRIITESKRARSIQDVMKFNSLGLGNRIAKIMIFHILFNNIPSKSGNGHQETQKKWLKFRTALHKAVKLGT